MPRRAGVAARRARRGHPRAPRTPDRALEPRRSRRMRAAREAPALGLACRMLIPFVGAFAMKTLVASLLLAAAAVPAAAGPDFVTPNPRPRSTAPSDSARELAPFDDIVFAYDSHALTP